MNAFAQLTQSLTADSGLAGDPTSAAFMPIIGKPLTVTKVVDGKKVVKANRKAAKTPDEIMARVIAKNADKAAAKAANKAAVPAAEGTVVTVEQVAALFPKQEAPKASAHDEWVAMQAENLRCAGFGKDDLQIVAGKRFKLQSGGKTLTWFTERQWAEDILAAI